jgi:hypothetical protein
MNAEKLTLSEEEIDEIVIAHADDESAWEEPVRVSPPKSMSLDIPSDLVVRAARRARVTRAAGVGDWLRRIVRERIELEEAAFAQSQRSRELDERVEDVAPPRQGRARRPASREAGAKGAKGADYSKRRA